jgi:SPP1 family predicted phage head-tail adaptor
LRIGNLRHRITIQQIARIDDGAGGYTETWASAGTVYADVYPLKGQERYDAQQIQANLSHRVTIRYRADVNPSMRLSYGTRTLVIEAVIDPEERHRELILMCSEVV